MRTFARLYGSKTVVLGLLLLCGLAAKPILARATDDEAAKPVVPAKDSTGVAKPAAGGAVNSSANVGLTERERMLLDRVELLERRVAELEAAHQPVAATANTAAASAVAATPGTEVATGSAAGANRSTIASAVPGGAGTASAGVGVSPMDIGNAAAGSFPGLRTLATQTAEKPKKAPASDPFAFADFTWLNGNPRTKEIPMDTKFFTPEIRSDVDFVYDFRHPKDDTISGSSFTPPARYRNDA